MGIYLLIGGLTAAIHQAPSSMFRQSLPAQHAFWQGPSRSAMGVYSSERQEPFLTGPGMPHRVKTSSSKYEYRHTVQAAGRNREVMQSGTVNPTVATTSSRRSPVVERQLFLSVDPQATRKSSLPPPSAGQAFRELKELMERRTENKYKDSRQKTDHHRKQPFDG
ncbi:MAG: hypothetical protein JWM11_5892 [Planctomycetaceae bacterium]|nr:hypothetical protein [Planctomycetaceae bacterium]